MNRKNKTVKRRRKIYRCSSEDCLPNRYNYRSNQFSQTYNNIYCHNRNNYKLTCSYNLDKNPYSQIPDRGYGVQNDTIIFKSVSPSGKLQDVEKYHINQMDSFDTTECTGFKNRTYKNEKEQFCYSMPVGYHNPLYNSNRVCTCKYKRINNICTCNSCDFCDRQRVCTCDRRRLMNSFSYDNIRKQNCTCKKRIVCETEESNLFPNEELKMQGAGLNILVESNQNENGNQRYLEDEDIFYLQKNNINYDRKELSMQCVNDLNIEQIEKNEPIQVLIPIPDNEIDKLGGFFIEGIDGNNEYYAQAINSLNIPPENKIDKICPENVDNITISHEYSNRNINDEYLKNNEEETIKGFALKGVKKKYSIEHSDLNCKSVNNTYAGNDNNKKNLNKNNDQNILSDNKNINNGIVTTNIEKNIYINDEIKKINSDKNRDTNSESVSNELNNNSTKIQSVPLSNFSSSHQSKLSIFGVSSPKEEWKLKTQKVLVLNYKGIPKQKTNAQNIDNYNNSNGNNINTKTNKIINIIKNKEIDFSNKNIRPQKKNWNIFNINQHGIELQFSYKNNSRNLDISRPNSFFFEKANEYENNNEDVILNNDYNTFQDNHLRMRSIHATILKVHDDDSRSSVSSYDFLQYVKTKNMIGINDSQNYYETEINKSDKNINENQVININEDYNNNESNSHNIKEKREKIIAIFEDAKNPSATLNNMIGKTKVPSNEISIEEKNMNLYSNENINNNHYHGQVADDNININKGTNIFNIKYNLNNEDQHQGGRIEINEKYDGVIKNDNDSQILDGNIKKIEMNKEINKKNIEYANKKKEGKQIIDLNNHPRTIFNNQLAIENNENQINNYISGLNNNIENEKKKQKNIREEIEVKIRTNKNNNNTSKIKSKIEINHKENQTQCEKEKQNIMENERQKIIGNTQKNIEENKKSTGIEQHEKIEKKPIAISEKMKLPVQNENGKEFNMLSFNKRSRSPLSQTSNSFNVSSKIEIKNILNRNPSADAKDIRKLLMKGGKMKKFEYLREEPCESNILKY